MKKNKQKRWHEIRAENQAKRTHKFKARNLKNVPQLETKSASNVPVPKHKVRRPITRQRGAKRKMTNFLAPPANFSLRGNSDEVARFFIELRHYLYNKSFRAERYGVDFAKIESFTPGAALMLAAELERWQSVGNSKLRAHRPETWQPAVLQTFRQMGLFELLNISQPTNIGDAPEIPFTFVRFQRGTEASGPACAELLDLLKNVAKPVEADNFIYDGLVEALKNALHHAYPEGKWYGVSKGSWWLCGAHDHKNNEITAAVFDLGTGIPSTLPKSGLYEGIRKTLANLGVPDDDANMIAAAMRTSRTRTLQSQRGKGMPIMMRFFENYGGHLRVRSGRGEVVFSGTDNYMVTNHPYDIGGTLIEWTVKQDALQ